MALRITITLAALLMPCSGSTEGVHCEGSVCQPETDQDAASALQFNVSRAQARAQSLQAMGDGVLCPGDATCPDGANAMCGAQGNDECECELGLGAGKGAHAKGRGEDCNCPADLKTEGELWYEAKARRFTGTRTTCRFQCEACKAADGTPDATCCGFLSLEPHDATTDTEFLCVHPPHGICVTQLCVRADPVELDMATGTRSAMGTQYCDGNACTFHPAVPGKVCVETCAGMLKAGEPVLHFVATWEFCPSKLPTQYKTAQHAGRPWSPPALGGGHSKGYGSQIVTVKATMGADDEGGHPGAYTPPYYTYQDTGAQKSS